MCPKAARFSSRAKGMSASLLHFKIGPVHCSSLQKGDGTYAPAYMLADNRMERKGRVAAGTPKVCFMLCGTRFSACINFS